MNNLETKKSQIWAVPQQTSSSRRASVIVSVKDYDADKIEYGADSIGEHIPPFNQESKQ